MSSRQNPPEFPSDSSSDSGNALRMEMDSPWILSHRGDKNQVDTSRPYAWLIERERSAGGRIQNVGTVFLTNRECPFKCLMCDLWKNTTDYSVRTSDLMEQIEYACDQFENDSKESESIDQLKLYNSGNFFDSKAIPANTLPEITKFVNERAATQNLTNLIIENHPKLVDHRSVEFDKQLRCSLEVAMGLETVDPAILKRLNKQMTLDDFKRAAVFLTDQGISVRCFILLRTPFMSESEGIEHALRAVEFAFSVGVNCCAVIPTRKGNGALDRLEELGEFSEPKFSSLERVLDEAMQMRSGQQRVFVDLWDAQRFSTCAFCFEERVARLNRMNLSQQAEDAVECSHCFIPQ